MQSPMNEKEEDEEERQGGVEGGREWVTEEEEKEEGRRCEIRAESDGCPDLFHIASNCCSSGKTRKRKDCLVSMGSLILFYVKLFYWNTCNKPTDQRPETSAGTTSAYTNHRLLPRSRLNVFFFEIRITIGEIQSLQNFLNFLLWLHVMCSR